MNLIDDIEINDEDVDYFNDHCKRINDLDIFISYLETQKSNEILDFFSFFTYSNLNITNEIIRELRNQLETAKEIKDSSYKQISDYFKRQPLLYQSYKDMVKAQKDLDKAQNYPLQIEDAVFLINSVLNVEKEKGENPFLFRLSSEIHNFTPERFALCMKVLQSHLDQNIKSHSNANNQENKQIKSKFVQIRNLIINCPFFYDSPLFPFSNFSFYLLDQNNEEICKQYLTNFSIDYANFKYQKDANKIPNFLSTKIQSYINKLERGIAYLVKDDKLPIIISIISENLVRAFLKLVKSTKVINYEDAVDCCSMDDLCMFETRFLINSINENNYETILKEKRIKIYNQNFVSEIIDKLDSLFNLFYENNQYPDLVSILTFVHSLKKENNLPYKEIYRKFKNIVSIEAFEIGKKHFNDQFSNSIFVSKKKKYFLSIENNRQNIEKAYQDNLKNFQRNFLKMSELDVLTKTLYKVRFCYCYAHGFISGFYENWAIYLPKLRKVEGFDINQICPAWIWSLYISMNLNHENLIYDNEILIGDIVRKDILVNNSENQQIPKFKRECYESLLNIYNTIKQSS